MTDYTLTERADADLFDIFVHGYKTFGIRQAETYAADLESVFQLLADNPRLGRRADAIGAGIHRHEHQSHVILYEPLERGILIHAIVHGRSVTRLAL